MAKIQRSIRLSPECDEALRVMAVREGRSVSQLIDRLVWLQFLAEPGSRSGDGRESARTKAARERGSYSSDTPDADLPPAERGARAESRARASRVPSVVSPRHGPKRDVRPVPKEKP